MAIYFIDGDNNPGKNTEGIEYLLPTEKVIVCFAQSNAYYTEVRQKGLIEKSKAEIEFISIPSGKNAVDFAVAIKAGIVSSREKEEIFLVSRDNHFDLIAKLLRKESCGRCLVRRIITIWEGIMIHPERMDLYMAKEVLKRKLGSGEGEQYYNRLEILYRQQWESEQKERALREDEYKSALRLKLRRFRGATDKFKYLFKKEKSTNSVML